MPTGYTAGIIDGQLKTFEDFAKQCARAFGAMIMMRDAPMSKPWEPRVPGDYHTKEIVKANLALADTINLSDSEIVDRRKIELEINRDYHTKSIASTNEATKRLEKFLLEAKQYVPPSPDHVGIKDFMIQQLTDTISWDGNPKYHIEALEEISKELETINADSVRKMMREKAERDLDYHTTEHKKEVERCETSNKWVKLYFESLMVSEAAS